MFPSLFFLMNDQVSLLVRCRRPWCVTLECVNRTLASCSIQDDSWRAVAADMSLVTESIRDEGMVVVPPDTSWIV